MEYVFLALAVLAAVGLGLVYLVSKDCCAWFKCNCSGDCNQGRNCHCKDGD